MQFEKEFAVKQYQQMLEEHEREKHRQKEEEEKLQFEELEQANQIAEFTNVLDQLYEIKEVDEDRENTIDADIVLEDIIDDFAIDALDLHDSDDSGSDLQQEGLDLDDLEEDAIPDDPLKQDNNIHNFEFIGQPSLISKQSLDFMESLRKAASSQMKSKVNPMESYKQFMNIGKQAQDAPPPFNLSNVSANQVTEGEAEGEAEGAELDLDDESPIQKNQAKQIGPFPLPISPVTNLVLTPIPIPEAQIALSPPNPTEDNDAKVEVDKIELPNHDEVYHEEILDTDNSPVKQKNRPKVVEHEMIQPLKIEETKALVLDEQQDESPPQKQIFQIEEDEEEQHTDRPPIQVDPSVQPVSPIQEAPLAQIASDPVKPTDPTETMGMTAQDQRMLLKYQASIRSGTMAQQDMEVPHT